ncbi:MAG: GNAT family N-acetyltransferase [Chromatiales bacterium]|nr:GNAT family N-acetyltransferase [Chromatiales bacterium]
MSYLIETPRLGLRHFCLDDLQDFFELGSDPEVIRYAEKHPLDNLDQARKVMLEAPLADYEKYGYGRFAVVWKLTGEVIGFCGMKFLPELGRNELGYRYKRKFWGQGIGTEAGAGTLEYAATCLGMDEAIALIMDGNIGSVRVAEKLGLRRNGTVQIYGVEALLYETALPASNLPFRSKLAP